MDDSPSYIIIFECIVLRWKTLVNTFWRILKEKIKKILFWRGQKDQRKKEVCGAKTVDGRRR